MAMNIKGFRNYLTQQMQLFVVDPPHNDFEKGYLAGLQAVAETVELSTAVDTEVKNPARQMERE